MSMKNNTVKKGLIFFIVILFISSFVIPMAVGHDIKNITEEKFLENLVFTCISANGFSEERYEYYKEQLSEQYSFENSNGDIEIEVEKEESKMQIKPPVGLISFGSMDSPWPMFCHDTHHTGRSPYNTADNPCVEKWRFYSSGSVDDTPVIDSDKTIYVNGAYNHLERYLYALYPDGTLKWRFKTGGLIWGSSPAIAEDGTVYVGSWDTKLYAVKPDGTEKWCFPSGGSISSSPAIAEDGTIYFGTLNNMIFAVNPDGTEKWRYPTGYKVSSDPAISGDGTVYIGSADDYLYALYQNGSLRWRFKTGDWIKGHPSVEDDGTIYIGSFDGYLYALYPNGTMKWKCGIGPGTETNPSIADDGTIYVGSNKLYAVYPNGSMRWSFDPGGDRFIHKSSPAISADGIIYVGTNIGDGAGGEIIAVNPNGTERWRKRIANEGIDSSPSIAEDGTVYIGSWYAISQGYLHAFGPQETNDPPTAPSITGPQTGKAGTSYDYKFVATDPNRNPVSYYVEWGDSTNTGWTSDYNTGEEITLSHAWSSDGTFTIKAKARDTFGAEGPEESLTVTMPRNRIVTYNSLFLRFLECFPLLERLLNLF